MNRERLKMVRDRIASEPPERLEMKRLDSSCGTAHCIAGWAVTLFPKERHEDTWYVGEGELGIEIDQAHALFCPEGYLREGAYTRDDALAALDSLINADSDDALPVWPEPRT